jgi:hypothetical protein
MKKTVVLIHNWITYGLSMLTPETAPEFAIVVVVFAASLTVPGARELRR